MIAIVDYDAGNIKSVEKALLALGEKAVVTRKAERILRADGVILPGVGSFGDAMEKLRSFGLIPVLQEMVRREKPFLGICLGLQLLFESSEESPGVAGLGILKGKILRIPEGEAIKVPHIGWNSLRLAGRDGAAAESGVSAASSLSFSINGQDTQAGSLRGRLFSGIEDGSYVYFVHSYYLQAAEEEIVTATTDYGVRIHASVESGNVFACQFHPEKSSDVGLGILRNFIQVTREGK